MSRRILIPLLLAALVVPFAMAQDNPAPQGGDRGGDRNRGNFDPAQMRQRRLDQLKEQMGVTNDEEWKVISAKLDPVMAKQREIMGGMFGGFGGGRGRGVDDANRQRSALETASRDLRTLLEDKAASEDQIKQKLAAYREARDKTRTELASLQKELKEILMPRQEAVLVNNGMLD
jgi:Spy/CpxP family protein refolding chaperone